MNVIPPRVHGIIDYGVVVFFLLAPTLFSTHLVGGVATLCYVLAIVHLTMTLLTDFPLGMVEVISLGVHGVVELIVAIMLVVLPWILAGSFQGAQWFYTVVGVGLFAIWLLSDYSMARATSKTSPKSPQGSASADASSGTSSSTSSGASPGAK